MTDGRSLMGVELLDTASAKHPSKAFIQAFWKGRIFRRSRRQSPNRRHPRVRAVWTVREAAGQPVNDGLQRLIVSSIRPFSRQHDREMVAHKERKSNLVGVW